MTDLQDEVAVVGVAETQVLLVQVRPEPGQVLVLPADVRGQDQRTKLTLHVQAEERREREDFSFLFALVFEAFCHRLRSANHPCGLGVGVLRFNRFLKCILSANQPLHSQVLPPPLLVYEALDQTLGGRVGRQAGRWAERQTHLSSGGRWEKSSVSLSKPTADFQWWFSRTEVFCTWK